jgi:hypothetical protein
LRVATLVFGTLTAMACSDRDDGEAQIDADARRLGVTALEHVADRFEQKIVNGVPDASSLSVGALVLDGRMHCTATVLSPRLLLTAAHCVDNEPLDHMTFVPALDVKAPNASRLAIEHAICPAYLAPNSESDVALVQLLEKTGLPPAEPRRDPLEKGQIYEAVGYGFAVIDGSRKLGDGWRRRGPFVAVSVGPIVLADGPAHLCHYDSGGPFVEVHTMSVLGIAIGGHSSCKARSRFALLAPMWPWIDRALQRGEIKEQPKCRKP